MKRKIILTMAIFAFAILSLHAQTTIRGTITDSESGEPLVGANVIVKGTSDGDVSGIDGNYSITTSKDFPFILEFSYTGFAAQEIEVTTNAPVNVSLVEGALIGQEIVVSASRRREKVQEAPASISVYNTRKLEASPNDNPVRNLVSAPGVNIQQQSAGRINIQLRGDGGLFGSASFPMLDYRPLVGAGTGTFDALNTPLNNIDIQRIEVVRGPGSALYGPGVTAGVVHFLSKSQLICRVQLSN